jgi:hypothetical protein
MKLTEFHIDITATYKIQNKKSFALTYFITHKPNPLEADSLVLQIPSIECLFHISNNI